MLLFRNGMHVMLSALHREYNSDHDQPATNGLTKPQR